MSPSCSRNTLSKKCFKSLCDTEYKSKFQILGLVLVDSSLVWTVDENFKIFLLVGWVGVEKIQDIEMAMSSGAEQVMLMRAVRTAWGHYVTPGPGSLMPPTLNRWRE